MVWSTERKTDTLTSGRVTVSRRDKTSGEFVQEFSGYVAFIGTACAAKALGLKPKQRVRLGDVDVTRRYDKEAGREYVNFNIYSFEPADESDGGPGGGGVSRRPVDHGEPENADLPF